MCLLYQALEHSVFYPIGELSAIFIEFKIVVCKLFSFGRVLNLLFGKVLTLEGPLSKESCNIVSMDLDQTAKCSNKSNLEMAVIYITFLCIGLKCQGELILQSEGSDDFCKKLFFFIFGG